MKENGFLTCTLQISTMHRCHLSIRILLLDQFMVSIWPSREDLFTNTKHTWYERWRILAYEFHPVEEWPFERWKLKFHQIDNWSFESREQLWNTWNGQSKNYIWLYDFLGLMRDSPKVNTQRWNEYHFHLIT